MNSCTVTQDTERVLPDQDRTPRRHPRGDWVLTLRCTACGSPSAWQDEQDGWEYCPAHLSLAQRQAPQKETP